MSDDLYLSRLTFDLRDRGTLRLLGDCHAMHRFVMSGFPNLPGNAAREALAVLYRVELAANASVVRLLVQSAAEPAWAPESRPIRWDGTKSLTPLLNAIAPGSRFRFRLQANPTRRVAARATREADAVRGRDRPEAPAAAGKRVALRREEDRLDWLIRKGLTAGLALVEAAVSGGMDRDSETRGSFVATRADPGTRLQGRRDTGLLTVEACTFDGLLEVRDVDLLRQAIRSGIGPGKAFGCGLLSLAPAASP